MVSLCVPKTSCGSRKFNPRESRGEAELAHHRYTHRLRLRQFAFARDTLVQFVHAFDAIFELATVLWELFGYFVDAAWYVATERGSDGHSLPDVEFMGVHRAIQCYRALALSVVTWDVPIETAKGAARRQRTPSLSARLMSLEPAAAQGHTC
jgi:hypothetical protein